MYCTATPSISTSEQLHLTFSLPDSIAEQSNSIQYATIRDKLLLVPPTPSLIPSSAKHHRINMKLVYLVSVFMATVAMTAPVPDTDAVALGEKQTSRAMMLARNDTPTTGISKKVEEAQQQQQQQQQQGQQGQQQGQGRN
ncbi:uncharacterized protein BO95DRAFT_429833 [Aspergillus brunneoviolaceus CBS 621.78]|uniref:Uncharacterized protein n=1 Tax=Aspergillus brunneoviolaceus CBS 621.78 TaxID=1450534 RepID=A0ACD1GFU2_9EURO|nr:hypothetical protein BO95DRAFT_429833 [Aspergillus brunneoviolaceus CBS 621.78]RAH48128.1 hypothetical protein BO95DRAFT_429833 [Aspergillus brunneoviolaceus CBS 621.78]